MLQSYCNKSQATGHARTPLADRLYYQRLKSTHIKWELTSMFKLSEISLFGVVYVTCTRRIFFSELGVAL